MPLAGSYLLMPANEFLALPTSGSAWQYIEQEADASWPVPDLQNQNMKHGLYVLAAALRYAKTGDESYRWKARDGIMAAIGTWQPITKNGVLSIARQLPAYVLAADFVGLSGSDDGTFRAFLRDMQTQQLGTHGRWSHLIATHNDSSNNWGAFAGASRIAVALYLGDTAELAAAERTLRGFLGDRSAWANFRGQGRSNSVLTDEVRSWACDSSASGFVPINPSCVKEGIDLSGAVVIDIARTSDGEQMLSWPPDSTGIGYQLENLQGLILQAELLYRNGYPDIWLASDSAIQRAAEVVQRSDTDGGPGWNGFTVSQHVPWLLNARYGTVYPTEQALHGRGFGFTDWLYGSR